MSLCSKWQWKADFKCFNFQKKYQYNIPLIGTCQLQFPGNFDPTLMNMIANKKCQCMVTWRSAVGAKIGDIIKQNIVTTLLHCKMLGIFNWNLSIVISVQVPQIFHLFEHTWQNILCGWVSAKFKRVACEVLEVGGGDE